MEHIKTRTIAKNYHSVLLNVASLIRNVPSNKTRSLQETNWKVCQEFVQKNFYYASDTHFERVGVRMGPPLHHS